MKNLRTVATVFERRYYREKDAWPADLQDLGYIAFLLARVQAWTANHPRTPVVIQIRQQFEAAWLAFDAAYAQHKSRPA